MANSVMINDTTKKQKGPKISGPDQVANFFSTLDHPLKEAMMLIREVILASQPGLTEHIKWNAPSFCHDGDDRVTFNLHKRDHVLLVFHRGAKVKPRAAKGRLIDGRAGLLTWMADDRATVRFVDLTDVKAKRDELTSVVREWIKAAADQCG